MAIEQIQNQMQFECQNHPSQLDTSMEPRISYRNYEISVPSLFSIISLDLSPSLCIPAFIHEKNSSMGLRSEEQGGKQTSLTLLPSKDQYNTRTNAVGSYLLLITNFLNTFSMVYAAIVHCKNTVWCRVLIHVRHQPFKPQEKLIAIVAPLFNI